MSDERNQDSAVTRDDPGRLPKLEHCDFKRGAVEYPNRLDPNDHHHLYTKPFYNLANKISRWSGEGLDEDTQRHFCDFANITYTLALPAGSRILDVGCGSGWLCEYLARLGYQVTGLDISPELIRLANERLSSLPYGVDQQTKPSYRFLVHDIEAAPLSETFDAVICYDALHHFEDENAVLRNIGEMLELGGQLFIAEGERPPEGSESEAELRGVMEQYETLESPFKRDYLLELLTQHGFAVVGDYTAVTGLVDRENVQGQRLDFLETPTFNYLLCKKSGSSPALDSRKPGILKAQLELRRDFSRTVSPEAPIEFEVAATNTGDTIWLVSRAPLKGRVRVGLKVLNERNETIAEVHGSPRLQRALGPGETCLLRISCGAPSEVGDYKIKIDLVNQDICWFEQHGSQPLILPFVVRVTS
jgi:SAM-dependent methyltransferase